MLGSIDKALCMRIGIYASIIASERGYEDNVSGHIQIPLHSARLLREAGHDVHLITNEYGPSLTLPNCMPPDVPVHLVTDARRRPSKLRGGTRRDGVRIPALLGQLSQMKKVVRENNLQVLHVYGNIRSALLGGMLRMISPSTPVVYSLVGGELDYRRTVLTRYLLSKVNAVITSTEYSSRLCEAIGLKPRLIRHGIVRRFKAESGESETSDRRRILFWRDLTSSNGADMCIRAFDRLAPDYPDLDFDFAIRPQENEVPGIDDLQAHHDNVHVYRFPYPEGIDLARLIAEAMVVVMPFRVLSVNPQFAITESVAAGVPVITTKVGSNPEFIQHETSGMLIEPGEFESLVDGLHQMLADRDRLREMGRKAADDFASKWNWDSYVSDILNVYEQVAIGN